MKMISICIHKKTDGKRIMHFSRQPKPHSTRATEKMEPEPSKHWQQELYCWSCSRYMKKMLSLLIFLELWLQLCFPFGMESRVSIYLMKYIFQSVFCGCIRQSFPGNLFYLVESSLCQAIHVSGLSKCTIAMHCLLLRSIDDINLRVNFSLIGYWVL